MLFQAAAGCLRDFETIFAVYRLDVKIPRDEGSKHKSITYKINVSFVFRLSAMKNCALERYQEKMRSLQFYFHVGEFIVE